MRIIAGEFRGRTIKVSKSKLVRPTTDRNRESLFNYLSNYFDFDNINVCDIYAGSGALGFEALSRGANLVDFVEKNFPIIKVLQENIATLKVGNKTSIYKIPAVRFSKMNNHKMYDLIIADPPFFHYDIHEVVSNILSREFLTKDGLLIVERSVQTKVKDIESFRSEPIKRLGDSLIYQFNNQ